MIDKLNATNTNHFRVQYFDNLTIVNFLKFIYLNYYKVNPTLGLNLNVEL